MPPNATAPIGRRFESASNRPNQNSIPGHSALSPSLSEQAAV
jgi:hypothetical protein